MRAARLVAPFTAAVLLVAACGDDGGAGGGTAGNDDGDDPDCVVTGSDVEDAFGGSVEVLDAPIEGLCTVSVDDSDPGGDGTIEIVFLHGRGGSADEQEEFEITCQTNQAEPIDDVGDDACYSEEFGTATVLVDDQIIEIRGFSFLSADAPGLRESIIDLAGTVARQA
ncbi:MAG: hypothetical protein ACRDY4_15480 [Acidimicrobiia bacterium]